MNIEPPLPEELTQQQRCDEFLSDSEYWTIAYRDSDAPSSLGVFSALAPVAMSHNLLREPDWEIKIGDGAPAFWRDQDDCTHYAPYGRDDGLVPLVFVQSHYDILPATLPQLLQEFCHYHNLWTSDSKDYKKLNRDGSVEDACEVRERSVRIRSKYLRQFQAAKQLMLVRYIDSINTIENRWCEATLQAASHSLMGDTYHLDLRVSASTWENGMVWSRLLGIAVTLPPPISQCGVWPWTKDEQEIYQRFKIGETSNGETITASCNPYNPGISPSSAKDALASDPYLTPVYFSLAVLDRYYNDPEKYCIRDSYLSCGTLWGVHIDNNHPDHVMVWLGDLGRDIPEGERGHWVLHNIVSPSPSISGTAFRRQILGEFAEPDSPVWRFKSAYRNLRACWEKYTGWELLRDPDEDDASLLPRLRMPTIEQDHALEDQIRILHRVLVEALNANEIKERLQMPPPKDARSILLLERWLNQEGYGPESLSAAIAYFRKVHNLRNKIAHRKSSNHGMTLSALDIADDKRTAMSELLSIGEAVLNDLAEFATTLQDASG